MGTIKETKSGGLVPSFFVFFVVIGIANGFDFIHHDQEALIKVLEDTHKKCPEITSLFELNLKSVQGRVMKGIIFGKEPKKHVPGIPEFK